MGIQQCGVGACSNACPGELSWWNRKFDKLSCEPINPTADNQPEQGEPLGIDVKAEDVL